MMNIKLLIVVAAACGGVAAGDPYREPFRPQFHFSPAKNWMNDPNGLVFYEGEYHLFYQYNPFGDKWGHMSWGHAVSPDLFHWENLPVALYEENDVMIFSGSAVIDWKNTSGFGQKGKPPMVAIYTGHYTKKPLQNQHIAYSNDRGRTWTKYSGNPVVDIGQRDFRDPKVSWHEPTKKWVMTVAWPTERKVRFYRSPNLKDWTHLSDFGPAGSTVGIWECPDLFPLKIEGEPGKSAWVLVVNVGSGAPAGGSGTQYFVGEFNGEQFVLDSSYPKPKAEVVPPGRLIADFEGENYGEWTAAGTAFGAGPAHGKIGGQQAVDGFRGGGLVNSFAQGDKSEGTLTSPQFEITHTCLNFLIGGGAHEGKTCLNLLVDGKIVRSAAGANAEHLDWASWRVEEFRGRRARLEIVDRATEGWGHINVDHIFLADAPAVSAQPAALWADYGPDFYAAVSWSDVKNRASGRPWLGWMSNWQYAGDVPTSPWRSAMSVPRDLTLRRTAQGLQLVQKPVPENEKLRQRSFGFSNGTVSAANAWLEKSRVTGGLWEIQAEFEPASETATFGFSLFRATNQETRLSFDLQKRRITLDRGLSGNTHFHPKFSGAYDAPLPIQNGRVRVRLLLDASSVECFAGDGTSVLTAQVFPNPFSLPSSVWSADPRLRIAKLAIWKLKSAVP